MDSATLEPMDTYLPEEAEDAQDPETESLWTLAEEEAAYEAQMRVIDPLPGSVPLYLLALPAVPPKPFVDYTLMMDQREDAPPDDFDEWCRACDEEMGDYPDREAHEAGRYIAGVTGGR